MPGDCPVYMLNQAPDVLDSLLQGRQADTLSRGHYPNSQNVSHHLRLPGDR